MSDNKDVVMRARALKNDVSQENLDKLMNVLTKSVLLVPAALPADISREEIKKLADGNVHDFNLRDGSEIRPAVMVTNKNEKFFPGFTSEAEMKKGDQNFVLTLHMPFEKIAQIISGNENIDGFVLNPFSENVVLNINANNMDPALKSEKGKNDLGIRQQLEINILPATIFNQEGFTESLAADPAEMLVNIYKDLYKDFKECPYTKDDFDCMVLNIRDDLRVIRMGMPEKYKAPAICDSTFLAENTETGFKLYFAIVNTENGGKQLFKVDQEGRRTLVGDAPLESEELNTIIDIFDKDEGGPFTDAEE